MTMQFVGAGVAQRTAYNVARTAEKVWHGRRAARAVPVPMAMKAACCSRRGVGAKYKAPTPTETRAVRRQRLEARAEADLGKSPADLRQGPERLRRPGLPKGRRPLAPLARQDRPGPARRQPSLLARTVMHRPLATEGLGAPLGDKLLSAL